jgi:hypothetical protein
MFHGHVIEEDVVFEIESSYVGSVVADCVILVWGEF